MKTHSKSKTLLALALAISLAATGCSAQWINVALQDLPVLTQMALNIATLVSTLAAGNQANTGDVAVIQNISGQASRGLNLLRTLYDDYKASPSPTKLQKIQNVISDLNRNLPALLESAHISNAVLSGRITVAVSLILTTVNGFASLMPQRAASMMMMRQPQVRTEIPDAQDLRKQWNQHVCAPSGNPAMDTAFAQSVLR